MSSGAARVAVAHLPDRTVDVEADQRHPRRHVRAGAVPVAEAHRRRRRALVGLGILGGQLGGAGEAVHEHAVAAVGLEHQAVQELDAGEHLPADQVDVGSERVGGVGQAVRFGLDSTSHSNPKLLLRRKAIRSATPTTVPCVVGAPRTKLTPNRSSWRSRLSSPVALSITAA